jgi:hypothetical protein
MGGFGVDEEIAGLAMDYKMTVDENPISILGYQLVIPPNNKGLVGVHQTEHIMAMLERWETHPELPMPTRGIDTCNHKLPYNKTTDLRNLSGEEPEEDIGSWRELVGDLQWIQTRPEIAFIVKQLSQAVGRVTPSHKKAAHDLLKYLRANPSVCLVYGRDPAGSPIPLGTVDSEYGYEQVRHGKASFGYGIMVKRGLVAAKAKTSKSVALSTCEAEVMGMTTLAQHLQKIRNYLRDLGYNVDLPSIVYEDNKGAVDYARNPAVTRGMRHIALRWHYARQLQQEGEIDIQHCKTTEMAADIFTKMLDFPKFDFCCKQLGLMPLNALLQFNREYAAGRVDLEGNTLN